MGVKKIIKLSVLLSGLSYSTALQLDFTTYTTSKSVCSGSTGYGYYDNPIVSNYQFVLDLSNQTNTVHTDAYNNSDTFTEVVSTSISNDSGVGLIGLGVGFIGSGADPEYSLASASVNQTYSQYESSGSIIGDMSISTGFNHGYRTIVTVEQAYTGNLPSELAPVNSTATIIEKGGASFSWDSVIGTTPSIVALDEAGLVALYDSLIGKQFSFYGYKSSWVCTELDIYGECGAGEVGLVAGTGLGMFGASDASISNDGYAILSVTTVVPVPAAVWLFGSSLIGLIGMARRKK